MKIQSRTEIKIEKHEIRTVRVKSGNSGPVYCTTCSGETVTMTPEQLASLLSVSISEICQQIDSSEIHLASNDRGVGLICGRSLESKDTQP